MAMLIFWGAALAGLVLAALLCIGRLRRGGGAAELLTDFGLAVLSALAVDWTVVSMLERRVDLRPETLFSLLAEGQPQAGRLAALLIGVLGCFALYLTLRGKALRRRMNEAYRKDGARWLISAAVTGLFVLWAMRITVTSFMTNDDTFVMRAIAEIPENGLRSAVGTFSNILFCGLLSLFYRIDPEGWWYAGYHIAAIALSLTVIGRCVLLKTARRGWPVLCGVMIHALLCAGVFAYSLSELSFTVTPAIVGSAAVALMLCRSDIERRAGRIASDIAGVVLMLLCYLQRYATGQCLLCFWGLAAAYQALRLLLRRDGHWKGGLLAICASVLAVFALISVSRSVIRENSLSAGSDYSNAEYYRSMVMDYLIGGLSDEQLEAAGLPPELSLLLRNWYFMDERINTDTFRTITEMYGSDTLSDAAETAKSLPDSLSELFTSIAESTRMRTRALIAMALLLLCAAAFTRYGRKYWPEFLCAVCTMGGAFLLSLYLVMDGRFPIRAFLVIALPAVTALLLMALSAPEEPRPMSRGGRCALIGVCAVLVLSICVFARQSVRNVPYSKDYADRAMVFESQWATEEYAFDHPDIFFVTNFFEQNLDPFHGGTYPDNMSLWGGTGVTASSNRRYADAFFRDDVRFMCENPGMILFVLQYLTLDNGPVQAAMDASLTSNIFVYDLTRIRPADGRGGWYEQDGMTYYFRDGQALTGTQVIDGETYEFAPAGAAARMNVLREEDRTLYTTNAYALTEAAE